MSLEKKRGEKKLLMGVGHEMRPNPLDAKKTKGNINLQTSILFTQN